MQTPDVATQNQIVAIGVDGLMDKAELALRLKISTRTLDDWMRKGRLPFLKIGKTVRFRWSEVLAHLEHTCRVN